jgi:hypothetical protein
MLQERFSRNYGVIADSLNHLFTMPFFQVKKKRPNLLINQANERCLSFSLLPVTCYRYPIPNDIKRILVYERPDILNYCRRLKDVDIQFFT